MSTISLLHPADPKVDRLAALPVFREVSRRRLRRLAALLDEIEVDAGDILVHQGELAREFVVVVSGNATVERDGEPIGNVGSGAFVGEMAVLDGRIRRNATVRAISPMVVLVGDARVFDAVLDIDPAVRRSVVAAARDRATLNAA